MAEYQPGAELLVSTGRRLPIKQSLRQGGGAIKLTAFELSAGQVTEYTGGSRVIGILIRKLLAHFQPPGPPVIGLRPGAALQLIGEQHRRVAGLAAVLRVSVVKRHPAVVLQRFGPLPGGIEGFGQQKTLLRYGRVFGETGHELPVPGGGMGKRLPGPLFPGTFVRQTLGPGVLKVGQRWQKLAQ